MIKYFCDRCESEITCSSKCYIEVKEMPFRYVLHFSASVKTLGGTMSDNSLLRNLAKDLCSNCIEALILKWASEKDKNESK